jgi:hypothetical protein
MTLRNVLKIVFGLLLLFAVAVGLTSINHPIILKWVTGSARHHGKPMQATVYTNGQVNDNIKVFYTDEANNYLLSLAEYYSVKNDGQKFYTVSSFENRKADIEATQKQ